MRRPHERRPAVRLPAQAPPVSRGPAGAGRLAGDGVLAARSRCAGLSGLAQQMCYAVRYGVRR